MLRMSGIRTGAYHCRALMRAHGWWHHASDTLLASEMKWGRRAGFLRFEELVRGPHGVEGGAWGGGAESGGAGGGGAGGGEGGGGGGVGGGGGGGGDGAGGGGGGDGWRGDGWVGVDGLVLELPSPSELDWLVGGLLLLAALSGRVLVLPEFKCPGEALRIP